MRTLYPLMHKLHLAIKQDNPNEVDILVKNNHQLVYQKYENLLPVEYACHKAKLLPAFILISETLLDDEQQKQLVISTQKKLADSTSREQQAKYREILYAIDRFYRYQHFWSGTPGNVEATQDAIANLFQDYYAPQSANLGVFDFLKRLFAFHLLRRYVAKAEAYHAEVMQRGGSLKGLLEVFDDLHRELGKDFPNQYGNYESSFWRRFKRAALAVKELEYAEKAGTENANETGEPSVQLVRFTPRSEYEIEQLYQMIDELNAQKMEFDLLKKQLEEEQRKISEQEVKVGEQKEELDLLKKQREEDQRKISEQEVKVGEQKEELDLLKRQREEDQARFLDLESKLKLLMEIMKASNKESVLESETKKKEEFLLNNRYLSDLSTWEPTHYKVKEFIRLLEDTLLDNLRHYYHKTQRTRLVDSADYDTIVQGVSQILPNSWQNPAQGVGNAAVTINKIREDFKQEELMQIFKHLQLSIDSSLNDKQLREALEADLKELARQLAYRFEEGIQDLKPKSITNLVNFFIEHITERLSKNSVLGITYYPDVNRVAMLIQFATIPESKKSLDKKYFWDRLQPNINIKFEKNSSYRSITKASIQGLLWRSNLIYPDGAIKQGLKSDKYPAQRVPSEHRAVTSLDISYYDFSSEDAAHAEQPSPSFLGEGGSNLNRGVSWFLGTNRILPNEEKDKKGKNKEKFGF